PSDTALGWAVVEAVHPELGRRFLVADGNAELLFTENDTNTERLWQVPNATPYVKDGIDRFVVQGDLAAVNPARTGTKVALDHVLHIPAGESTVVRLRLTDDPAAALPISSEASEHHARELANWDSVVEGRRAEADEFYGQ